MDEVVEQPSLPLTYKAPLDHKPALARSVREPVHVPGKVIAFFLFSFFFLSPSPSRRLESPSYGSRSRTLPGITPS